MCRFRQKISPLICSHFSFSTVELVFKTQRIRFFLSFMHSYSSMRVKMVIMDQCARYRFSVDKKEPTMGIMLSLLVVDLKGNKSWPSLNAEHTLSSSRSWKKNLQAYSYISRYVSSTYVLPGGASHIIKCTYSFLP